MISVILEGGAHQGGGVSRPERGRGVKPLNSPSLWRAFFLEKEGINTTIGNDGLLPLKAGKEEFDNHINDSWFLRAYQNFEGRHIHYNSSKGLYFFSLLKVLPNSSKRRLFVNKFV